MDGSRQILLAYVLNNTMLFSVNISYVTTLLQLHVYRKVFIKNVHTIS